MNLSRRRLLFTALAAPVIIRTPGLLMPVRKVPVVAGAGNYGLAGPVRAARFDPQLGDTITVNGSQFIVTGIVGLSPRAIVEVRSVVRTGFDNVVIRYA